SELATMPTTTSTAIRPTISPSAIARRVESASSAARCVCPCASAGIAATLAAVRAHALADGEPGDRERGERGGPPPARERGESEAREQREAEIRTELVLRALLHGRARAELRPDA